MPQNHDKMSFCVTWELLLIVLPAGPVAVLGQLHVQPQGLEGLEEDYFEHGAEGELGAVDVLQLCRAFLQHELVEEDVLEEAEEGAGGQDVVPGPAVQAAVQGFHLGKVVLRVGI